MSEKALLGDVGGTNARFALAECSGARPIISNILELSSPAYASGADLVRDYLKKAGIAQPPRVAVIAVAGPVTKGVVHITNLGWSFAESELRQLGIAQVCLLNDFEAQALATVRLTPPDLHTLGPAQAGEPHATVIALGPGTGFGASALVRGHGGAVAMAAEGGHASFAPNDDVEREIQQRLAAKFDHVSIERLLSGPGLQNLHAALNDMEGIKADAGDPTEITTRAMQGEAPFERTVLRFCAILGSVAGDFALINGARGGVFIAGGIAPSILPLLDRSDFRARFEAKGRFRAYLAPIPTQVVLHPHAAFLGDAEVARRM